MVNTILNTAAVLQVKLMSSLFICLLPEVEVQIIRVFYNPSASAEYNHGIGLISYQTIWLPKS